MTNPPIPLIRRGSGEQFKRARQPKPDAFTLDTLPPDTETEKVIKAEAGLAQLRGLGMTDEQIREAIEKYKANG